MSQFPYKVVTFNTFGTPTTIARAARLEDALAVAVRYEGSIVRNPVVEIGEPMLWDRFGTVAETRWR